MIPRQRFPLGKQPLLEGERSAPQRGGGGSYLGSWSIAGRRQRNELLKSIKWRLLLRRSNCFNRFSVRSTFCLFVFTGAVRPTTPDSLSLSYIWLFLLVYFGFFYVHFCLIFDYTFLLIVFLCCFLKCILVPCFLQRMFFIFYFLCYLLYLILLLVEFLFYFCGCYFFLIRLFLGSIFLFFPCFNFPLKIFWLHSEHMKGIIR